MQLYQVDRGRREAGESKGAQAAREEGGARQGAGVEEVCLLAMWVRGDSGRASISLWLHQFPVIHSGFFVCAVARRMRLSRSATVNYCNSSHRSQYWNPRLAAARAAREAKGCLARGRVRAEGVAGAGGCFGRARCARPVRKKAAVAAAIADSCTTAHHGGRRTGAAPSCPIARSARPFATTLAPRCQRRRARGYGTTIAQQLPLQTPFNKRSNCSAH